MQPLLPTLLKGVLMSLGVVAAMFGLTYLPQVAVLAFISGPLGWFVVGGGEAQLKPSSSFPSSDSPCPRRSIRRSELPHQDLLVQSGWT